MLGTKYAHPTPLMTHTRTMLSSSRWPSDGGHFSTMWNMVERPVGRWRLRKELVFQLVPGNS